MAINQYKIALISDILHPSDAGDELLVQGLRDSFINSSIVANSCFETIRRKKTTRLTIQIQKRNICFNFPKTVQNSAKQCKLILFF